MAGATVLLPLCRVATLRDKNHAIAAKQLWLPPCQLSVEANDEFNPLFLELLSPSSDPSISKNAKRFNIARRMRLNFPRVCLPQQQQQQLLKQLLGQTTRRSYAVQAPGGPVFEVFSRRTKWLQKERAAANVEASRQADYLKDEVAMRVAERLLVRSHHRIINCPVNINRIPRTSRESFPVCLTSAPTRATLRARW